MVQRSALFRSRRELSNEYLLAKIGVDTAENEPLEVWGKYSILFTGVLTATSAAAALAAPASPAAAALATPSNARVNGSKALGCGGSGGSSKLFVSACSTWVANKDFGELELRTSKFQI